MSIPVIDNRSSLAPTLLLGCLALVVSAVAGCTGWPFGGQRDRTSIITPGMRTAAIREMGPRARKADAIEQQRICQQLAQQIQTEPDPIVRQAIQETIAGFDDPLAGAVLMAGLGDDHREVRLACCRQLGQRKQGDSVAALQRIAANDDDVDVRLAAVDALGQIGTRESMQAISVALDDRNPALQFAGVQALRLASGERLGNEVATWRQYVASLQPESESAAAIASKPGDSSSY